MVMTKLCCQACKQMNAEKEKKVDARRERKLLLWRA